MCLLILLYYLKLEIQLKGSKPYNKYVDTHLWQKKSQPGSKLPGWSRIRITVHIKRIHTFFAFVCSILSQGIDQGASIWLLEEWNQFFFSLQWAQSNRTQMPSRVKKNLFCKKFSRKRTAKSAIRQPWSLFSFGLEWWLWIRVQID